MLDLQLLIAAFAANCLSFALLALSLDRHWRQVMGQPKTPLGLLGSFRVTAYLGLALSWIATFLRDGPGIGTVLWITLLAASGMAIALILALRPQWLRPLAAIVCKLNRLDRSAPTV